MMSLQRYAVFLLLGATALVPTTQVSLQDTTVIDGLIETQADGHEHPEVELSATLTRILDSPAIDETRRQALKLFHGQWDDFTAETPDEEAALAWASYRLSDPSTFEASSDLTLRAEVALFRGDAGEVLRLLQDEVTVAAAFLRGRALEDLGRLSEAVALLTPLRERFQHETLTDPAELTAGANAIVLLAHLEGRPSQDYELALGMYARAYQELDPLYWPARVAEAQLLMSKDNWSEASDALQEALSFNPKAGIAWYELGRLWVDSYNFDAAAEVSDQLRTINPIHPLADVIDIRSFLRQCDVASARKVLVPALKSFPKNRELLALAAATEAMAYDDSALASALDRFDQISTGGREDAVGSPLALYIAGEYMSLDRQYIPAEDLLRRAIERSPNWPAPRLELGLLLMQSGDLKSARLELAHAQRLDPFHQRINNQLRLVEDLLDEYETIETENFVIRYRPGIDEVLARDMPGPLEELYDELTAVFQHRPANKTQIDLMPDQSTFAVRITGMPDIWTIAAATGDVISMTPPRSGPDQFDPYNWVNVMRHEFVHTVNLAQTQNRVPHWFTEACAVSSETTGRTFDSCQLLAWAVHNDKLFEYDQINWGFVRPKTDRERPLAYAQSDWMLEFIAIHWSHQAVVDLLDLYREGVSDTDALKQVTGYTADAFMDAFSVWAEGQVQAWGLGRVETSEEAAAVLASGGQGIATSQLVELLEAHGNNHPDLLKLVAERAADGVDPEQTRLWLNRYAQARPVDPWPHKVLTQLAFDLGRPEEALGSLQLLERSDTYTSTWSHQLAEIHRSAGRLDAAQRSITRALYCEPYHAPYRELAATIAIQRRDLETAAFQVEALAILEPDRAQHPTRLAVIYSRLNRPDDAHDAAQRALELNPNAKVQNFLKAEPTE
ncbi:tetratricopeptide repeat protein [Algisphaera agarilytica]|uniref:Tetratricopeptide (TPR) repeat protein n=1 Tax=Algisphaera agarilytica TaxID=1385975 RepID=A0A7X0H880_9BACT|nr:tetratricopeptide repeat protein [Algisphaera agarilytica]MBB6431078.1 tetratricopeptide (TPR) repeat protein [Algisphaera agarilytica]